jgi:hypothetical protein
VHGLDIVRMIVSPRSSHTLGVYVIGHDVVVIGECFFADAAHPVLRCDLAIEQLSHLSVGTEFTETSGMMRIFDALHAHLFDAALLRNRFPAAAVERAMDGALLVTAEFHLNFS